MALQGIHVPLFNSCTAIFNFCSELNSKIMCLFFTSALPFFTYAANPKPLTWPLLRQLQKSKIHRHREVAAVGIFWCLWSAPIEKEKREGKKKRGKKRGKRRRKKRRGKGEKRLMVSIYCTRLLLCSSRMCLVQYQGMFQLCVLSHSISHFLFSPVT